MFTVCKKYCKVKLSLINRENCEGRDSARWVTWLLVFIVALVQRFCVEISATKDSRHENWYETSKHSRNKRENRGNKSRQAFLRPFMRQRRHLICQAGFHERAEKRLKFVEGISVLINREFRACVPTINEHIAKGYAGKSAGRVGPPETTHTTIAPKFNYIRILIKQEAYPSLWPVFPTLAVSKWKYQFSQRQMRTFWQKRGRMNYGGLSLILLKGLSLMEMLKASQKRKDLRLSVFSRSRRHSRNNFLVKRRLRT